VSRKVILTCAVTGEGPFSRDHPDFPVTPQQIAQSAIAAAHAGAAVVHLHVRDPQTGEGARDPDLFRQVVERIRSEDVDVVLNLSAGMGGDFCPDAEDESRGGVGTDIASPRDRIAHVALCRPEMCSLDVVTMNAEAANARLQRASAAVYLNTTRTLRAMAREMAALAVKPEIEVFGPGDVLFAKSLIEEGAIARPPHFQFVMGVKWGMPCSPETLMYMRSLLPEGATWAALGLGRQQMHVVALAAILGGHCRVGLEDNHYLEKGVFATNVQLVERAAVLIRTLGYSLASAREARELLAISR
jgi:3-dehydrocarnitine:acetyl-CoA trimethylamine transferase